jgi:Uma2 family endonuclease
MATRPTAHRFSVEEYHRMAEAGIFAEDDRVELIDGKVVEMTPTGSHHAAAVNRMLALFQARAGTEFIVTVQNPVVLDDLSEPEPDLALLR